MCFGVLYVALMTPRADTHMIVLSHISAATNVAPFIQVGVLCKECHKSNVVGPRVTSPMSFVPCEVTND